MESAYTLANRELKNIREENKNLQEERRREVISKAPELNEIEAKLRRCGTELARCILDKKADFYAIKEEVQGLQVRRKNLLTDLGLPADYLDEIYTCSICNDVGFNDKGERCSCLKNLISKYVGLNANMTRFMAEQTFDKFDFSVFSSQPPAENGRQPLECAKKAYDIGLAFAENFDNTHDNLLMMGNAGTGKTFLSSCIGNYTLKRGKSVYYQTAFQLFDMLEKLKFGKIEQDKIEQAEYAADYVYKTDLLIIDDLGTEFVTAYSTASLFDIINTRQIQEKSTIISTNLTVEGLEKVYGRRLTSRLFGMYKVVPFIGKDLRLLKFKEN